MGFFLKYIINYYLENQFTVYYGLGFDDRFEQQLAKIFFSVT